MAACWALEPAPFRVPLSCSLLLAASLLPLPPDSLAAPHAASAREPASAIATGRARVLVLSFNSMPLDIGPWERDTAVSAGRSGPTSRKLGSRSGLLRGDR